MRESSLEDFVVAECMKRKVLAVKHGRDGWPDRQILRGTGLHFWLELKSEEGDLRPAQYVIAKLLTKLGDRVYIPRNREHVRTIFAYEWYGDLLFPKHLLFCVEE
jgi:hypothetical protein